METPQQSNGGLQAGLKIYDVGPNDNPGVARPGEPLPRPFVIATMPYAKWLILESSAERVAAAEAELAAITESSQK